jgi:hypothetical protein
MGGSMYNYLYGDDYAPKHSGGMCRVEEEDLIEYVDDTEERPVVEIKNKTEIDDSYVMTWGRFRSCSLRSINIADPSYLTWLRNYEFVRENQQWLVQKIDDL